MLSYQFSPLGFKPPRVKSLAFAANPAAHPCNKRVQLAPLFSFSSAGPVSWEIIELYLLVQLCTHVRRWRPFQPHQRMAHVATC